MAKKSIYIGTSGWHYKHWTGTFYPKNTKDKDQLGLYLQTFNTVELNNSFYRLPSAETFGMWRKATPDNFVFAVKANRFITHNKKLLDPEETVSKFMDHAKALKEKLGPVLFQLPPGWKVNIERLAMFLSHLPEGYRYTFEFRNHTWYTPEVYELLLSHNCAFCIYELAGHQSPEAITADFVYIRLHGPGRKYSGDYPEKTLVQWAKKCREWKRAGKDIYVYFDNDEAGYAAFNAQRLYELTRKN